MIALPSNITQEQADAIRELEFGILNRFRHGADHEYKRFEVVVVSPYKTVSIVTEVGMVGDEGTMAQFLARDYRHIFVGAKGAIELKNASGTRKRTITKRGYWNAIYAGSS